MVMANLFESVRIINSAADKKDTLSSQDLELLKQIFNTFLFDILGLKDEKVNDQHELLDGLMKLVLAIRQKSRETKDWGTSDQIRDTLQKLHISVKDGKEGSSWNID
jgi:cysteinyl-tRNA synthetase